MAFNGSGTYSLPSGNPVVTGTTISSATHNNTNSDIATALTNCVTRDGQSPATADIPMGSNKITDLAEGTVDGDAIAYGQQYGSEYIDFLQAGAAATIRPVQAKLRETVSVKDFGAVGNGVASDTTYFSAASVASNQVHIPAGTYKLSTTPTSSTSTIWHVEEGATFTGSGTLGGTVINTGKGHSYLAGGALAIYDYLISEASYSAFTERSIAITGGVNTSHGTGAASDAHIGVAAFSYNDYPSGSSGAWGMYSTNVRKATATGPTQGMEIDIANLGTTTYVYPASLSPVGLTTALWLGAGGEITGTTGDTTGTASCAIGILRNDQKNRSTVNFDKGIVFGSTSINGTDGTSGSGIAIAMSSCHSIGWYDTSNHLVGAVSCNIQTYTNAQHMQITDSGTCFTNIADSKIAFRIGALANVANRILVSPCITAQAPTIATEGDDTNIDLYFNLKGTGKMMFGTYTAGVLAATGYISIKDASGVARRLLVG
jgi:hypothetical protein